MAEKKRSKKPNRKRNKTGMPRRRESIRSRRQKPAIHLVMVNQSQLRLPRIFLADWVEQVVSEFRRLRMVLPPEGELTIVFLDPKAAQSLNFQYRKKDYATDVLSFLQETGWGDLVICPEVLRRQAKEHGLTFREELGYMVIHGMLHLLGYDHEVSEADAKIMFRIQDRIFARLLEP